MELNPSSSFERNNVVKYERMNDLEEGESLHEKKHVEARVAHVKKCVYRNSNRKS